MAGAAGGQTVRWNHKWARSIRRCLLVAATCGLSLVGLETMSFTNEASAATCPRAPFVLPKNPTQLKPRAALVAPTIAAEIGTYRTLMVGTSVVVAAGAMHSDIVLVRGVSNNDFAVSVYSHGP